VPSKRAERKLAAILAADVAGYSRLMGADEEGTLTRLKAHRRELMDPKIAEHRGRVVKTTGDGILIEFPSVVDAVRCAVEVQHGMTERNTGVPEDKRITFRVGVNLGDIIVEGEDIYGDGVNIAARLEAIAAPGSICISEAAYQQVRDKLAIGFEDLGERELKNIARPLRVYALEPQALSSPDTSDCREPKPAASDLSVGAHLQGPAGPFAPTKTREIAIVVLPFTNLSPDPEQDYFADGITEDLTTDLSRLPGSIVIARHTAFTYKGQALDVRQIGRDLGVRYVIEGSVRRAGEQVRVNVQLIDADNGTQTWADRFDTDRVNLAAAQNTIAGRLARTLNLQLIEAAARRLEHDRLADPDARDLVMRGWAFYYRSKSRETMLEARRSFERALAIDPPSLGARIGLALCLVHGLADGWSRSVQEDETQADRLLREALERDTNQPMARVATGLLRRYQNRLSEAQAELEMAVALDNNNADALRQLGLTLLFLGRPDAAIPPLEAAIRLNPRDPNLAAYQWPLGLCHLLLGHLDGAIDFLRKACAGWPWEYFLHLNLAGALGLKGELDEARLVLSEALRLRPDINSLARYRAATPWITHPAHWALREKTLNVGLRRAGLPDE
jgi:class 3 adenylate cyclase/TolB-like protein/tetratricopeptide (TPR) repeat protein